MVVEKNKELFESKQRQQIYDGKDSLGKDLSPTYFNDPYFKTQAQAKAYSDWKDKITPSPKRKSGVPNLWINGFFHKSISVKKEGKGMFFKSSANFVNEIIGKYGERIFGTNKETREEIIPKNILPDLKKQIEAQSGLKF